jgi:8-oxo-dGTP pyrophosphatase MutT (NUDIX family)
MANATEKRVRHSPLSGRGDQSRRPPSLQVGALCWRRTRKGALRILLITSRDTGRWVIPKGWPMRRRTEAEAAAREAWEEAGVEGEMLARPVGLYSYPKIMPKARPVPCVVRVYPLAVATISREFPEAGQRRLKWFSPAKAARRVQEPELARILRSFDPGDLGSIEAGAEGGLEALPHADDPAAPPAASEPGSGDREA